MAVDIPGVREVVERVFARPDVLTACRRRDLSMPITVLCANGVTQAQIATLTGIPQGRISEYKTRKRVPTATATFEAFADGLGLPPAARLALGLAPEGASSDSPESAAGRPAAIARADLGDVRPLLSNLSRTSAVPVLSALRGIHRGYVEADRLMGSLCVAGPIQLQMPVIERACEVSRGADRVEMLRFACQFSEFGGWIFQDAGDLACAMQWTNRALDYALELGDERVIAYTLMRKAMIATEGRSPAQGLGIADAALKRKEALTRGSGRSSCASGPIRTRSWARSSLPPKTLMKQLPKRSQARIRVRKTGRLTARRRTRRWKPEHPGCSSGIRKPRSRSWRKADPNGQIIQRSATTPCACHAWRWRTPLRAMWSGPARPPMRSWRLLRDSARAG